MQKYAVFSHPIVPFDYKNVGKTKKSAKKEINNERHGNNLIMQSYAFPRGKMHKKSDHMAKIRRASTSHEELRHPNNDLVRRRPKSPASASSIN